MMKNICIFFLSTGLIPVPVEIKDYKSASVNDYVKSINDFLKRKSLWIWLEKYFDLLLSNIQGDG